MDLVTGHAGTNHVSAADISCMLRCMYGDTDCVYDVDGKMACTVADSNTLEIATGAMSVQGYFSRIDIAEQLTIDSGSPGYKRNDLVIARYELGDGNVQTMTLAVVKGTPTTTATATDPDLVEGSIDGGDILAEFAIWRIPIDGTTVGTPVRVLPILTPFLTKASSQDSAIQTLQDSVDGFRLSGNVKYASFGNWDASNGDGNVFYRLNDNNAYSLQFARNYIKFVYQPSGGNSSDVWSIGTVVEQENTVSNILTAGSNVTVESVRIIKWGHVCMLRATAKPTTQTSANVGRVLFTLKSAFRPAGETFIVTSRVNCFGVINASSGEVSINCPSDAIAANTTIYLWSTYIVS